MDSEDEYMKKRGLSKFEQSLATWDSNEDDTCDKAHCHFEELEHSFTHWVDVAEEARRLYAVMFDEQYDDYSPKDALIGAAVAAAYSLAISHVAKRFGVEPIAVRIGLETCDTSDADRFVRECKSADAARKKAATP